jgi:hypothetical protein
VTPPSWAGIRKPSQKETSDVMGAIADMPFGIGCRDKTETNGTSFLFCISADANVCIDTRI